MAETITSTAAEGDIIIEQGATFDIQLTWEDDKGDLINLTGYDAALQVRDPKNPVVVLLDMNVQNARIILGNEAGTIRLRLTATETSAITFSDARYQFEVSLNIPHYR